jgi:ferric iron reductase protein FhuF
LAKNYSTSQRTKHIDIRTHFVREFVEDGIIKVVFVKSEDNDADIFTKNTTEELFEKHSKKMVEKVKQANNE